MSASKQNSQQHFSDIPELQKLFEEAKRYIVKDGTTKRISLYRRIEKRAKELKAEKELGIAYSTIAKYYFDHQQYKTSLKYIFIALPLVKNHNLPGRVSNLYNWLAAIYLFTGDYSNALDYFQMEIEHNIKSGIEQNCFIAYSLMGNIYNDIDDDVTAEKFYIKAKELAIKYPDFGDVQISTAHLNTAIIVLKTRQEKYDEAEQLCYETIKISENLNDKRLLPIIYGALSLIQYDLGNYKKGLKFIEEAERHLSKNDIENHFTVARQKAFHYSKLGNKVAAASEFRKSFKYINDIVNIPLVKIETLHRAAELFESVNLKKDLAKVQKLLKHTEVTYQTLQSKLAIRAEQLIAFTAKFAPAEIKPKSDKIEIHAIGIGRVQINVKSIFACQTQQDKFGKNVTGIFVKDDATTYRVPSPLRGLYARLGNSNFVWINKNAFINLKHLVNNNEIKQKGKITLYGNSFNVSRSKRNLIPQQTIEI